MSALELDGPDAQAGRQMAQDLALAAGADFAYIGFYDGTRRRLQRGWTGGGAAPAEESAMLETVSRTLATHLSLHHADPALGAEAGQDGRGAASEAPAATSWLRSGRYLFGLGESVGNLRPVAVLRSGLSAPPGELQRRLIRIGLGYADRLLQERLGATARGGLAEAILRSFSCGVVVADAQGAVAYMTESAERWLVGQQEFRLQNGRLVARDPQSQARLHAALGVATGRKRPSVIHLGGPSERLRTVVVLPMERTTPLALVVVGQEQDDSALSDLLLETLGLTRAERRLAQQLLAGKSLGAAARDCNLTISTARTYLKSIFAKTGINRQSQLITLCHALIPPVRLNDPPGGEEPRRGP